MGAYGPIGLSNGLSQFAVSLGSSLTCSVQGVQNGPTQLCIVSAGNVAGVARYLKFFDAPLANLTSGAGQTAIGQMIIPGNSAGGGTNLHISQGPPTISGIQFQNGLAFAVTANQALADASGIQGDVTVWLAYR